MDWAVYDQRHMSMYAGIVAAGCGYVLIHYIMLCCCVILQEPRDGRFWCEAEARYVDAAQNR
jgi:hypothetical protein